MALKYALDQGFGGQARLGLIVLSTDETLENEARNLLAGRPVSLLHSRIPAQPDVTPKSLATMENHMTATAALLPAGLDVVGYGCTSGATVIGPERVAALVRKAQPEARVTNPLTGVVEALKALNARKISLITPYVDTVNAPLIAALAAHGIEVVARDSFLQENDWTVARITESDTLQAAKDIAKSKTCDAIFASCTNLRCFGILEQAEAETGVPMISSNLAFLWHMLKLAGLDARGWGPGRLFQN
ncbi:maleate cis-trans isomerase family protein [Marimonas lutisalis]|uniref:maleate cis-trans isomerase family protein n=1 Tax=Marimonas lutisalis TaxID=2545756 RepID=UPI001F46DF60|nr:Asp/Glu racemase [Marimonas lutisalis]